MTDPVSQLVRCTPSHGFVPVGGIAPAARPKPTAKISGPTPCGVRAVQVLVACRRGQPAAGHLIYSAAPTAHGTARRVLRDGSRTVPEACQRRRMRSHDRARWRSKKPSAAAGAADSRIPRPVMCPGTGVLNGRVPAGRDAPARSRCGPQRKHVDRAGRADARAPLLSLRHRMHLAPGPDDERPASRGEQQPRRECRLGDKAEALSLEWVAAG
jgi:hypothetical protein